MSGAEPEAMRTPSWASNSLEPSYFTLAPVHFSHGLNDSMNGLSSGATMVV